MREPSFEQGFNLPPGCSPNDPNAPWNAPECNCDQDPEDCRCFEEDDYEPDYEAMYEAKMEARMDYLEGKDVW